MVAARIKGVLSPVVTPFKRDLSPDVRGDAADDLVGDRAREVVVRAEREGRFGVVMVGVALEKAFAQSGPVQDLALRYTQTLIVQMAHLGGGIASMLGRIRSYQDKDFWGLRGNAKHGRTAAKDFDYYL